MRNEEMQFSLVGYDDSEVIMILCPGREPVTLFKSQTANYEQIFELARAKDDALYDLIAPSRAIAKEMKNLSERVSVANDRIYFDRDEVHNSLSDHILRLYHEGGDYKSWVLFMERLDANPQQESKDMLYDFLAANEGGFTLTPEGLVVAYKGVQTKDGEFHSLNSGTAYVEDKDGQMVQITGTIPYRIGTYVEMPRSEVAFDPDNPCSTGLHVATWSFAQRYGYSGVILEVHVDPRDIVSVPRDAGGEKVRVCRLFVKGVVEKKHDTATRGMDTATRRMITRPIERIAREGVCDEPEDIDSEDWLSEDEVPEPESSYEGAVEDTCCHPPKDVWKPNKQGGFFDWFKNLGK